MSVTNLSPEDIMIRAQDTPNPNALKFIVNVPLRTEGKVTFHDQEECVSVPLAFSLFEIPGVKQIYFFKNTVTVTHTGELPGEMVKDQCISVINTRIVIHDPDFYYEDPNTKQEFVKPDRSKLSPELLEIEEILDRTIRPGLQADGGDVEVLELSNNELKIMYQGACGGCPSAMMGTLDAIQNILRHELTNDELIVIPI